MWWVYIIINIHIFCPPDKFLITPLRLIPFYKGILQYRVSDRIGNLKLSSKLIL